MCLSLYALLLRTLVIDLHAKHQHNLCKCIEKVLKTVPSVKFTKSKACLSVKSTQNLDSSVNRTGAQSFWVQVT